MIGVLLILVLILALVGIVPAGPHRKKWGRLPTVGLGLIRLIVFALIVFGWF